MSKFYGILHLAFLEVSGCVLVLTNLGGPLWGDIARKPIEWY
jgi:hypothetical protein